MTVASLSLAVPLSFRVKVDLDIVKKAKIVDDVSGNVFYILLY